MKISKSKYKKRLEFIVVHELGHYLVKNQRHYKNAIYQNLETKHKVNMGMHCPNNKCVMFRILDLKSLDKNIKTNYKNFFCVKCLSNNFRII